MFRLIVVIEFYPRPPRGGRQSRNTMSSWHAEISIHALREEGDLMMLRSSVSAILFLSTPSARRATEGLSSSLSLFVYFYPRPPRGGRQLSLLVCLNFFYFLSTPSARRATHSPVTLR